MARETLTKTAAIQNQLPQVIPSFSFMSAWIIGTPPWSPGIYPRSGNFSSDPELHDVMVGLIFIFM